MTEEAAAEVWELVLERLRETEIPASTIALWIEPARPVGIEDGHLVCLAPDAQLSWLARRYLNTLGRIVRSVSTLDGIILRLDEANPDFRNVPATDQEART